MPEVCGLCAERPTTRTVRTRTGREMRLCEECADHWDKEYSHGDEEKSSPLNGDYAVPISTSKKRS